MHERLDLALVEGGVGIVCLACPVKVGLAVVGVDPKRGFGADVACEFHPHTCAWWRRQSRGLGTGGGSAGEKVLAKQSNSHVLCTRAAISTTDDGAPANDEMLVPLLRPFADAPCRKYKHPSFSRHNCAHSMTEQTLLQVWASQDNRG